MSDIDCLVWSVTKDMVWALAGGRELLADLYQPAAGVSKRTALLHLHGGGFRGGSKDGARLARHMAALGYAGVASQYRLSAEAKWPAEIHDVKTAIRWIHVELQGPTSGPGGLFGYSVAGGQLSLIAAGSQNATDFKGDGGNTGAGTDVVACWARCIRRPR